MQSARYVLAASLALATLLSTATYAATSSSSSSSSSGSGAPSQSGPQGGPPPGPPPEAIAACKGKSEGTTVTFSGRNGESFTGVCKTVNGVLAAMPTGGHPGSSGNDRPPPPAR